MQFSIANVLWKSVYGGETCVRLTSIVFYTQYEWYVSTLTGFD